MGLGSKFKIKESPIDGRGAFAVEEIRKGELICHMEGEQISIVELKKRYQNGKERLSDPLQVDENEYLDLNEPYVLINHSCDPNSAIMGYNELVAIKNIKVGEEITYDYSLTEWSNDRLWRGYEEWFMECRCKSLTCRKKIGEFNLLSGNIQNQSIEKGSVRDFIVRKYMKYNETGKKKEI